MILLITGVINIFIFLLLEYVLDSILSKTLTIEFSLNSFGTFLILSDKDEDDFGEPGEFDDDEFDEEEFDTEPTDEELDYTEEYGLDGDYEDAYERGEE